MAIVSPPSNPNDAFEWILARHQGSMIRNAEDIIRQHRDWAKEAKARRVANSDETRLTTVDVPPSGAVEYGSQFRDLPRGGLRRTEASAAEGYIHTGEYIPPEAETQNAQSQSGVQPINVEWVQNASSRKSAKPVKKPSPITSLARKALSTDSGSRLNTPHGRVATVFAGLLILTFLVIVLVPVSINGTKRTRWQLTRDVITGKAAIPGGL